MSLRPSYHVPPRVVQGGGRKARGSQKIFFGDPLQRRPRRVIRRMRHLMTSSFILRSVRTALVVGVLTCAIVFVPAPARAGGDDNHGIASTADTIIKLFTEPVDAPPAPKVAPARPRPKPRARPRQQISRKQRPAPAHVVARHGSRPAATPVVDDMAASNAAIASVPSSGRAVQASAAAAAAAHAAALAHSAALAQQHKAEQLHAAELQLRLALHKKKLRELALVHEKHPAQAAHVAVAAPAATAEPSPAASTCVNPSACPSPAPYRPLGKLTR